MYAQVVFSIASFRSFTYRIPHTLTSHISVGVAVNAPFKNKLQLGYIVSTAEFSSYKGKLNDIDSIYEGQPNIPQDLWKTILWMSNYYKAPIGLCIKSALPNIYYKDYNTKKILYIDISTQFSDNIDSIIIFNAYDALVDEGKNGGGLVPLLASGWEYADSNTLNISLKDGIKFHSGNTLDADDVVYSFNRLMNMVPIGATQSDVKSLQPDLEASMPYARPNTRPMIICQWSASFFMNILINSNIT